MDKQIKKIIQNQQRLKPLIDKRASQLDIETIIQMVCLSEPVIGGHLETLRKDLVMAACNELHDWIIDNFITPIDDLEKDSVPEFMGKTCQQKLSAALLRIKERM